MRANTFGFYALNGNSVVDFKENSRQNCFCEFLEEIRINNPKEDIVVILDNFPSHKSDLSRKTARILGIELIFLPVYSPDLNPIEFIWKSLKRLISPVFVKNVKEFHILIKDLFLRLSVSLTFAEKWIHKFL